jgi:hypothetical protein
MGLCRRVIAQTRFAFRTSQNPSPLLNPTLRQLGIDKKLEGMSIKRYGNYAFRHMNATVMDEMTCRLRPGSIDWATRISKPP